MVSNTKMVNRKSKQSPLRQSAQNSNVECSPYSFSKKGLPIMNSNDPSEMSVRLFNAPSQQIQKVSYQNLHSRNNNGVTKQANTVQHVQNRVFVEQNQNVRQYEEPVGYARIDLMNNHTQESESDTIPLDHLNSKLSRIENAVNFFYDKMHHNYSNCMNEVGTLKDYIEHKTEKKANSRMNSAYGNSAILQTPIGSKLKDLNISSKKNTPLITDG